MNEQSTPRYTESDGNRQDHSGATPNPGKKEEGTPIYLTPDSTLQTPAEHRHDQSIDPRKETRLEPSNDDLNDPRAGREAADDANA